MTTSGGVEALIAAVDVPLSARVYRFGEVPARTTRPYATVFALPGATPELRGDGGRVIADTWTYQVSVWQDIGAGEDDAIVGEVIAAVEAARHPSGFRFIVSSVSGIPDPDEELRQDALTVDVTVLR